MFVLAVETPVWAVHSVYTCNCLDTGVRFDAGNLKSVCFQEYVGGIGLPLGEVPQRPACDR